MSRTRIIAGCGAVALVLLALMADAAAAKPKPVPPPTVSSVSATSGPTAGGTRITLHGSGFTQVTSVHIGGVAGTALHVVSSRTVQVTTPARAIGRTDVRVLTKHGTSAVTAHDHFTFRRYTPLAAGASFACALVDQRVHCWGENTDSQLGNGGTTNSSVPVTVSGLSGVVGIAAGTSNVCALRSDGSVWCWGSNADGASGTDNGGKDVIVPTRVNGISDVVEIAADSLTTCAVVSNGTARCWGSNQGGALGAGSHVLFSTKPVVVKGLSRVVDLSASLHSCAVTSAGSVYCWGQNGNGELGDGTTTSQSAPIRVPGLTGASAVGVNPYTSCAVVRGAVVCWGFNGSGQLGVGSTTDAHRPERTVALSGVTAVRVGAGDNTCAVSHGAPFCWGARTYGAIGDGTDAMSNQLTPAAVLSPGRVTDVAVGSGFACSRRAGSVVECWGLNASGQLGDATTDDSPVPVRVGG